MTLIYEKPVAGPATHALVVGVGAYAHLPGGGGTILPKNDGLEQLSSPPHSARAFASWLLGSYCNPHKPLASLDLIVSDSKTTDFTLPDGTVEAAETAEFGALEGAIQNRWFPRGDENPEHLLIFYFCGHGVSRGLVTSLLLADFGKWPNNPLRQALNLREFYAGMDKCKARHQVYFVDACRTASPSLIEDFDNYAGDPIIPGSAAFSQQGIRYAPIYFAAVPGTQAFGRVGKPSVFTEALLKSFEGVGSNFSSGYWRVDTNTLDRGIETLMRKAFQDVEGREQVCSTENLLGFELHTLNRVPEVPVTVGCVPEGANPQARLYYCRPDGSNKVPRPELAESEWDVDITAGYYRFSADFPAGGYQAQPAELPILPPYQRVTVEVKP